MNQWHGYTPLPPLQHLAKGPLFRAFVFQQPSATHQNKVNSKMIVA